MEAAPLRNVETTSPGSGPTPAELSPSVAAARIVRRLRHAVDWRPEIEDILEMLGRSLAGHRSILFRLRERLRGQRWRTRSQPWQRAAICTFAHTG